MPKCKCCYRQETDNFVLDYDLNESAIAFCEDCENEFCEPWYDRPCKLEEDDYAAG